MFGSVRFSLRQVRSATVLLPAVAELQLTACFEPRHVSTAVKVKVKVSLEEAVKAQRGSRGIALLFL
jgi:hypothetical protein